MAHALANKDVDGIAATAHKLLPLSTLIGASDIVDLLRTLETERSHLFSEDIDKRTRQVIALIGDVLKEARCFETEI